MTLIVEVDGQQQDTQESVTKLRHKLHRITSEVSSIAKAGKNEKQDYSYVKAEDVVRTVREKFVEHGVLMLTEAHSIEHFTDTGGKQFVTKVGLQIKLVNVEDADDTLDFEWIGAGADIGGEKGLYKAYTGGIKYFLLNLFMVPTGDDPERDNTTESVSANPDTRDAAPAIPVDRAYSILNLAKEAKHADIPESGSPALSAVFRTKLATVGVDKIGDLNVDQAEDVEAWLKDEAASA